MNTQSLNLPEDLGYTARHVWARKDGDTLGHRHHGFRTGSACRNPGSSDLPEAALPRTDDEFGTGEP